MTLSPCFVLKGSETSEAKVYIFYESKGLCVANKEKSTAIKSGGCGEISRQVIEMSSSHIPISISITPNLFKTLKHSLPYTQINQAFLA
jgi:predicted peroxiredoxin